MFSIAPILVLRLLDGATDAFVTVAPTPVNTARFELGGWTLKDKFVPEAIEEIYNLRGRTE